MRELILGGARSGKSNLAMQRALASGREVVYVATALPSDAEMSARIGKHRASRPSSWRTVEAPTELAAQLRDADAPQAFIIVDCLTLWLSNVLCVSTVTEPQFDEANWQRERDELLQCLNGLRSDIVLVSNEVGLSIVPDHPVARRFRDEQGWLNQTVAACCERVTFVAAGLPLILKATS